MASKLIAAIVAGVACVQQNLQTVQLIAADSLPQRMLCDSDDEDELFPLTKRRRPASELHQLRSIRE